jgi:UDP-glucose 4-epimerase
VLAHSSGHSEIKLIPYEQAYETGFVDMRRRVPDTSKIRTLMGWQPTIPLDQTLDEVITDFRRG